MHTHQDGKGQGKSQGSSRGLQGPGRPNVMKAYSARPRGRGHCIFPECLVCVLCCCVAGGGSCTPSALLSPQGGQVVSDVSANVNDGSQEKLFSTEATVKCVSGDASPAKAPTFPQKNKPILQGSRHENLD